MSISSAGAANRMLLDDRLQHALADGTPSSCSVALLMLDLDRFKATNDTWATLSATPS